MSEQIVEDKLVCCIEQLEKCVKEYKALTRKVEAVHSLITRDAVSQIEEGVEILKHQLEEEL